MFASAVGTPLGYSNVYNRVLQPALKACGLDGQGIAFHAFRKACGSMLCEGREGPRQVQRWLGHSQLMTTMNIYVTDLDDGLGGADELDGPLGPPWGHRPPADSHKRWPRPTAHNPTQGATSADSRNPLG